MKKLELCKTCDIWPECETPCKEAVEYRPIPAEYYTKDRYKAKGVGAAFVRIDGSRSNR